MKTKEYAIVMKQEQIAAEVYSMWIDTSIAREAVPGQFICVYPKDKSKLLPRPISICEVNKKKGSLRIVYRIAGGGTREFSNYKAGFKIAVLGPLGNGYSLEAAIGKQVLVIGGGIGIPPMLELAKQLDGKQEIVLGFKDELFLEEEFEAIAPVTIATEDGSAGTKGNVLDAIRERGLQADMIYACGPMPMLRALKQYAIEQDIPAWISLEERMACGVGACLGCVCKTVKKDEHSNVDNARICTEGPVFDAREVEI